MVVDAVDERAVEVEQKSCNRGHAFTLRRARVEVS
jgi:hypothetical protein